MKAVVGWVCGAVQRTALHLRLNFTETIHVLSDLMTSENPSFDVGGLIEKTPGAFVEYLSGTHAAYDCSNTLDEHVLAINLRYAESKVAYASDKLRKLVTLKNGCVFAPAGAECREVSSAQTGETVFISFDPEMLLSQAQSVSKGSLREFCFAPDLIDPAIGALAQEMRRYFLSGHIEGEAYMEHLVSCIALRLIATMTGKSLSVGRENEGISQQEFDAARATIEDSLEGPISVADLASYSGMATTRFAKAFRNTAGISVYQYILDRRIARATNLLVSQSDCLADIAYACGFSSQTHMTTVFGKKLGVTPGQYRLDAKD